jgi:hypothetical protein
MFSGVSGDLDIAGPAWCGATRIEADLSINREIERERD